MTPLQCVIQALLALSLKDRDRSRKNNRWKGNNLPTEAMKAEAVRLYLDRNYSLAQASVATGVSKQTVINAVRAAGYKTRTKKESHLVAIIKG